MKNPPVLIKSIKQKDNHVFTVDWSDNISKEYRLSSLQKNCPCAKCYDPTSGKQLTSGADLDVNVRAAQIKSVGRYALKIQFSSGCSRGIYSYAMLRSLESS
ncbi:MAG: DUF971 domain-containing protein [Parachlamydiaceae bacterium]